jgi:hypothetical protein
MSLEVTNLPKGKILACEGSIILNKDTGEKPHSGKQNSNIRSP